MHATVALLVLAEGGECSLCSSRGDGIDRFASMVTAKDWLKKKYQRCNVYHCSRQQLGP
jgi:hypothetical protein